MFKLSHQVHKTKVSYNIIHHPMYSSSVIQTISLLSMYHPIYVHNPVLHMYSVTDDGMTFYNATVPERNRRMILMGLFEGYYKRPGGHYTQLPVG